MKALIGCEESGEVRRAMLARGIDAWSCDLAPARDGSNRHIIGDVRDVMTWGWDLLIVLHPPCTRLCNSGVRWLTDPPPNPPRDSTAAEAAAWPQMTRAERQAVIWRHLDQGADLFAACLAAPVDRVAVENPVMHRHAKARIAGFVPHRQSVQPWQFGTDEAGRDNVKKRTLWWLRGLPPLVPTGTLDGRTARADVHRESPGPNRARNRSTFFPGMAAAIADQWGQKAMQEVAA